MVRRRICTSLHSDQFATERQSSFTISESGVRAEPRICRRALVIRAWCPQQLRLAVGPIPHICEHLFDAWHPDPFPAARWQVGEIPRSR